MAALQPQFVDPEFGLAAALEQRQLRIAVSFDRAVGRFRRASRILLAEQMLRAVELQHRHRLVLSCGLHDVQAGHGGEKLRDTKNGNLVRQQCSPDGV